MTLFLAGVLTGVVVTIVGLFVLWGIRYRPKSDHLTIHKERKEMMIKHE